jgi:hypothetical protein
MDLPTLVWAAEILPQGLASIWRGAQQFVFVETLAKLRHGDDWQKARQSSTEAGYRPGSFQPLCGVAVSALASCSDSASAWPSLAACSACGDMMSPLPPLASVRGVLR